MKINLSKLEKMGETAVRCTSAEQAEMFMDAMWEQYPHLVKGIWTKGVTNWYEYGYDKIGEICYKPRIVKEGYGISYCQSANTNSAIKDGYKIIEFDFLCCISDLGELTAPEFDIKSLFGMR